MQIVVGPESALMGWMGMSIGTRRTRILYVMPAEKITVFVANAISRCLGQLVEVDIVDSDHLLSSFRKKESYDAVLICKSCINYQDQVTTNSVVQLSGITEMDKCEDVIIVEDGNALDISVFAQTSSLLSLILQALQCSKHG